MRRSKMVATAVEMFERMLQQRLSVLENRVTAPFQDMIQERVPVREGQEVGDSNQDSRAVA